jgi:hypothetical protein
MITVSQRLAPEIEQFRAILGQFACGLRVACPGIVQSFDPVKQTVVVKLAITENVRVKNAPTPMAIPPLLDCPIVIPRAGGFSLTLPVQAGDECLVIFADANIGGWYQSGGVQGQVTKRRHSLSDGIAILGCWSQPNVIPNYSTTSAQLRNAAGTTMVEVQGSVVNVTAPTVNIQASGGTTTPLLISAFLTWFETVYMPSVKYVSTQPPNPTGVLTTVLKAQ